MQFKLYSRMIAAKKWKKKSPSVEEAKIKWDSGAYDYIRTFPDVDSVLNRSKDAILDGEILVNDRGSVFVYLCPDFICIA